MKTLQVSFGLSVCLSVGLSVGLSVVSSIGKSDGNSDDASVTVQRAEPGQWRPRLNSSLSRRRFSRSYTRTQTCTDQHNKHRFIALSEISKRMQKEAAAADDRVDQGSL